MLTPVLQNNLEAVLQKETNKTITINGYKPVPGGDINQAFCLQTTEGYFFLKLNDVGKMDMFRKEYSAHHTLSACQTLKIPAPIAYGVAENKTYLLMEYLERGDAAKDSWQQLGKGLAELHKQTENYFGFKEDNYIGSLPQRNKAESSWAVFYAHHRILPLIRVAFDKELCTAKDVHLAEDVCERLPELFPKERPSLLHGDLWSGNFMFTASGQPAIFDPAVYYGSREMDIAMSMLFGGFDKEFYHHYNETFPLKHGWQDRVPLCQLYPLLVHLVLFGKGYYERVVDVLKKYG